MLAPSRLPPGRHLPGEAAAPTQAYSAARAAPSFPRPALADPLAPGHTRPHDPRCEQTDPMAKLKLILLAALGLGGLALLEGE